MSSHSSSLGRTFRVAAGSCSIQPCNCSNAPSAAVSASVKRRSAPGGTGGIRDEVVRDLAVYGDDLFVAGAFTSLGSVPARYIARYDTVAGQWATLGSGLCWYNDEYTAVYAVAISAD